MEIVVDSVGGDNSLVVVEIIVDGNGGGIIAGGLCMGYTR